MPAESGSPWRGFARSAGSGIVLSVFIGRVQMRWETPQAIDFRFGMEITLYIARR